MSGESTSYHEASHAVAAVTLGLPVRYASIRPDGDEAGRAKFDTSSEGFQNLGPFECAIVKISGEVGERMLGGSTERRFNWFAEGEDAEDARHFIEQLGGDELDARHWAVVRAYALLRTRWEAVEAIAEKLQRHTTVLGEEVERICLAEAGRRSARSQAATAPKRPPAKALKRAAPQLAEVDRQIAAIKGELDQHVNDDPSLWPLRKKLASLHNKRQELLNQLEGGVRR